MKNKINLNPNPMAKALVMQELTFRKMKDVAGTERRAQIGLYGEPAWNRRYGKLSFAIADLIDLNADN